MIDRARAIAIGVACSVVLAFALAWLVEQVPVVGIVIYFAAIGALGWTIWKVAASEQPLRSALMVGLTFACSFALVALLSVVLAADHGGVDAGASTASSASTSVVAATPGTDGPQPDGGPTGSGSASPSSAEPTVTTSTTPTAATTSTTAAPAAPPTAAPATTAPPSQTSTTAPPPAPPDLSVVDPADCDCDPGDDLTGLGVRLADGGDGVVIDVGTVGEDTRPVWLWRLDAPGEPIVVDVAADAEPRDGGWSIQLPGVGTGPWAVVSSGGDRVPDVGFLTPDGDVADTSSSGVLAARFERVLAEVEQAIPRLDDDVAALVTSLMARQVLTGTITFRRIPADGSGAELTVDVVNEWPRFSQSVTASGEEVQSLYATGDGVIVCVPATGGHDCNTLDPVVPLAAAVSVVRDPGAVVLEPADGGEYDGRPTTCVRIVEVPDNGPSLGLTCWLANGMSSRSVRDGIDTIELVSITSDIDPTRLEPPGDG